MAAISCIPSKHASERLAHVKAILARGNIARFNHVYTEGWKDVNDATLDEDGDMNAFRKSDSMRTLCVAWDTNNYSIEEIQS